MRSAIFAAALTGLLCAPPAAPAQPTVYTWTAGAATNRWSSGSPTGPYNWTFTGGGHNLPPTTSIVAFTAPSAYQTVDLQTSRTVAGIQFGGTAAYTLTDGSLTLSGGGVTVTGTVGSAVTHVIDAPVSLGASGTWSVDVSSLTVSGAVTDGGAGYGLTKTGSGTLTLTGASTYTGGTTVSAGTLQVGSGGTVGSIVGSVADNAALAFNRSDNVTFAGAVSGTGTLTQLGAGNLTLTGTSTYTGSTTVSAGTLTVAAGGSLTGTAVTVNAGGTLAITGGSVSVGSPKVVSLGGTATLSAGTLSTNETDLSGVGSATFTQTGGTHTVGSALVLGAGGFGSYSLSGTGQLSTGITIVGVQGTGTFIQTGGTHVAKHGLYLGYSIGGSGTYSLWGGTLQTSSIADGPGTGTFYFSGGTLQANANTTSFMQGLTAAYVSAGGAAIDTNGFSVTAAQPLLHDATVGTAPDGGLTQPGTGTLILTGANTYTGVTRLNAGTLQAGSAGALGTSGAISFGGGALQYSAANTTDYSGRFSQTAGQAYSIDTNGQNVTFASPLTSSGGTLTKLGSGTLTLAGANTYAGGTTVSAGTLQVGGGGTAGAVFGSVADNAVLAFNRSDNVTFSGAVSGTGTLTQIGAGILSLTGTNTYTGGTQFNAGTLSLGSTGALGTSGPISFGGGTLQYSAVNQVDYSGRFSTAAGQAYSVDTNGQSVAFASPLISSGGTLTKLGGGTLTLAGANTYAGGTTVSGGILQIPNGSSLPNTPVTVNGGTLAITGGSVGTAGTYNDFTVNGTAAAATLSAGSLTSLYTNIGTGTFTQTGGTHSILGPGTGEGCLFLGVLAGNSGTYSLGGGTLLTSYITGGSGTSIFYFDGGTLRASSNNAGFVQGLTAAYVRAGGAVIDTNGFNVAIPQALLHDSATPGGIPDGGLTKFGAGTLTLTGANSYTGPTIVSAGKLALSGTAYAAGFASLTVAAGATIQYDTGTRVFGGFLYGPGTHLIGAGGASFTGTTAFNGAVIAQNNPATFASFTNSGAITSGAALIWNGGLQTAAGSLTLNATAILSAFESDGAITISPGGVVSNSGSNLVLGGGSTTYLGSQAANGGKIDLGNQQLLLRGGLLVNNGGNYASGNGVVNGTVVVDYGGLAKGSGFYNSVTTQNGGQYLAGNSPGLGQVGTFAINPGGTLQFDINDAAGTAGPQPPATTRGWSLTQVFAQVNFTATPAAKFNVNVVSLLAPGGDSPGAIDHFDPTQPYSWAMFQLQGTAGVNGTFDPNAFNVVTSNFANSFNGTFAVGLQGQNIVLAYAPVPEPADLLLYAAAAAAIVVRVRRRVTHRHCRLQSLMISG